MAVPKKGELLRGYTLLEDFKIVGGGTCQWTFASKDGGDFFIKMFLDPRLPTASGLGSEAIKAKKRERCRNFERHQRDLMERVRKVVGAGGNLVAPIDFFEQEGYYYKVARKVTVTPGAEKEIPTRAIQDRITLCVNVCSALQSLHSNSIVHGDLKLDNILLQKSPDGGYLAKVIDFDSSYVVGSPPPSEEILGDPPYYSPELLDFIQERGTPATLTTASDIFSLGIVFCEYMTGKKPSWSGEHNYLSEAVRADEKITLPSIPGHDDRENRLLELIRQMISKNPADRPSLFKLKIDLMAIRDGATGGTPVPPRPPGPSGPSGPSTDDPTTTSGTPTPPTSTPKSDLETLGDIIKTLVDQIIAKSATPPPGAPAGGSRLRGTGVSLATAPAATPPDNSAIIASFTALADELKKIAGS
jgi:serine/threonine protein kinase